MFDWFSEKLVGWVIRLTIGWCVIHHHHCHIWIIHLCFFKKKERKKDCKEEKERNERSIPESICILVLFWTCCKHNNIHAIFRRKRSDEVLNVIKRIQNIWLGANLNIHKSHSHQSLPKNLNQSINNNNDNNND